MGVKTLAIVNVVGSSIARDHVMYTLAGPEIAVATTKAYSTQLICMYIPLHVRCTGKRRDRRIYLRQYAQEIVFLPEKVASILTDKERIQWFANKIRIRMMYSLSVVDSDYAICQEGSLKMKEVSYVHSHSR